MGIRPNWIIVQVDGRVSRHELLTATVTAYVPPSYRLSSAVGSDTGKLYGEAYLGNGKGNQSSVQKESPEGRPIAEDQLHQLVKQTPLRRLVLGGECPSVLSGEW